MERVKEKEMNIELKKIVKDLRQKLKQEENKTTNKNKQSTKFD